MKKMIPVYILQILMLAAVLFVGRQVVNEMRSMKTQINAELANTKQPAPWGTQVPRRPEDAAVRVVIVGSR
jgi:hypothetical protein